MRLGISLILATILMISILLTPVAPLNGIRQRLADLAFDAGLNRIGYNLILVSAKTKDPRALNNLGALLFWGKGTQKSEPGAILAFRDAVLAGSRRAVPNLRLAAEISCGRPERLRALADILQPVITYGFGGFRQYLDDCRANLNDRELIVDKKPWLPSREYIRAAMQADGFVLDRAGAQRVMSEADRRLARADAGLMYELGARMHGGCYSFPAELREELHRPFIAKTFELLLNAAEAGKPEAYALLADLNTPFGGRIRHTPIGTRLQAHDTLGWLEFGADNGCWTCRCKAARLRSEQLIERGTVEPDDVAKAQRAVEACLQETKPRVSDEWRRRDEYIVYHSVDPVRPENAEGLKRTAADAFKKLIAVRDGAQAN
jgi:TPR repeat protein